MTANMSVYPYLALTFTSVFFLFRFLVFSFSSSLSVPFLCTAPPRCLAAGFIVLGLVLFPVFPFFVPFSSMAFKSSSMAVLCSGAPKQPRVLLSSQYERFDWFYKQCELKQWHYTASVYVNKDPSHCLWKLGHFPHSHNSYKVKACNPIDTSGLHTPKVPDRWGIDTAVHTSFLSDCWMHSFGSDEAFSPSGCNVLWFCSLSTQQH